MKLIIISDDQKQLESQKCHDYLVDLAELRCLKVEIINS